MPSYTRGLLIAWLFTTAAVAQDADPAATSAVELVLDADPREAHTGGHAALSLRLKNVTRENQRVERFDDNWRTGAPPVKIEIFATFGDDPHRVWTSDVGLRENVLLWQPTPAVCELAPGASCSAIAEDAYGARLLNTFRAQRAGVYRLQATITWPAVDGAAPRSQSSNVLEIKVAGAGAGEQRITWPEFDAARYAHLLTHWQQLREAPPSPAKTRLAIALLDGPRWQGETTDEAATIAAYGYLKDNIAAALPALLIAYERYGPLRDSARSILTAEWLEQILANSDDPQAALALARHYEAAGYRALIREPYQGIAPLAKLSPPGVVAPLLAAYPFVNIPAQQWIDEFLRRIDPKAARKELDDEAWQLFQDIRAGQHLLAHGEFEVYRGNKVLGPAASGRAVEFPPQYDLTGNANAELVEFFRQSAAAARDDFYSTATKFPNPDAEPVFKDMSLELHAERTELRVGEPLSLRLVLVNGTAERVELWNVDKIDQTYSGSPEQAVEIRDPLHQTLRLRAGWGARGKREIIADLPPGQRHEIQLAALTSFVPKYVGRYRIKVRCRLIVRNEKAGEALSAHRPLDMASNVIEIDVAPLQIADEQLVRDTDEPLALPPQVLDVVVDARGRVWHQLSPYALARDWSDIKLRIAKEFASPRPRVAGAKLALVEPDGRAWFVFNGTLLAGYDGRDWIERVLEHPLIGDAPTHGQLRCGRENCAVAGAAWFVLEQGVLRFADGQWIFEPVAERQRGNKSTLQLCVAPDGQTAAAYLPGEQVVHVLRDGRWLPPEHHKPSRIPIAQALVRDDGIYCSNGALWSRLTNADDDARSIDDLVAKLSDDSFRVREQATAELLARRDEIRKQLEEAAKIATDPEAKVRLRTILSGPRGRRATTQIMLGDVAAAKVGRVFWNDAGDYYLSAFDVRRADELPLASGIVCWPREGKSKVVAGPEAARTWSVNQQQWDGPILMGSRLWLPLRPDSPQVVCWNIEDQAWEPAATPRGARLVAIDGQGDVYVAGDRRTDNCGDISLVHGAKAVPADTQPHRR